MVIENLVMVGPGCGLGADVDGDGCEFRYFVEKPVVCVGGDVVGCDEIKPWVDHDPCFSGDPVPDPAKPDVFGLDYPGRGPERRRRLRGQPGVDRVHEAAVDVSRGAAQHSEDRHRDEESDERVGEREPCHDTDRAAHHGEGVNPSVRAWTPSATSAADPMCLPTRMR